MDNDKRTITALLTGAAIGAGIGLLFAPRSGEETREQIREWSDETSDQLQDGFRRVSDTVNRSRSNVTSRIKELSEDVERLSKEAVESGQKRLQDELDSLLTALEEGRKVLKEERARRQSDSNSHESEEVETTPAGVDFEQEET